MAEDYTFEITFAGERDSVPVIEITCIPKPDAPVVWGKVVVRVRRDDWMPLQVAFSDEDLDLARTITYHDVREMGGRRFPTTMTVIPTDEPDEYTRIRYETIAFDLGLDDALFSLRTLQR